MESLRFLGIPCLRPGEYVPKKSQTAEWNILNNASKN